MSGHTLTYSVTPEMQNRAMVSWAKPMLTRSQKWRRNAVLMLTMMVASAVLVALLQYDVVTQVMLFSAVAGFYAAILFWFVSHRRGMAKLTGFATEALLRQGSVTAIFGAESVVFRSDLAESTMDWRSFDEVIMMKDATVLRAGALVYPLPDAALPENVTPQEFRDDLIRWMMGAR